MTRSVLPKASAYQLHLMWRASSSDAAARNQQAWRKLDDMVDERPCPRCDRALPLPGRRLAAVGGALLRKLLDLIARAKAFVEPCCDPGKHGSVTHIHRQCRL